MLGQLYICLLVRLSPEKAPNGHSDSACKKAHNRHCWPRAWSPSINGTASWKLTLQPEMSLARQLQLGCCRPNCGYRLASHAPSAPLSPPRRCSSHSGPLLAGQAQPQLHLQQRKPSECGGHQHGWRVTQHLHWAPEAPGGAVVTRPLLRGLCGRPASRGL